MTVHLVNDPYIPLGGETLRVTCFALEQTTSTLTRTQTRIYQSISHSSHLIWMLDIAQKHTEGNMIGTINKKDLSFDYNLNEHLPTNLTF